jgi:EpsI family protein
MNEKRIRPWVAMSFALLAVSTWLSQGRLFRQEVHADTALTRGLPSQIGKWRQVSENEVSAAEIRGLETRDIIKRTYTDGNSYIELVVAYIAQSNRKSAHAQEACLRGSGALVGSLERRNLRDSPVHATIISIDNGQGRSWVYYWYKIGDQYTSDYLKSSFKMFLGGLVGGKSHGASLIRLLTPSRKGEPETAIHLRLEDFTRSLLPELGSRLP